MKIILKSFGYKGTVPPADIYLDARVITNPFHVSYLNGKSGDDKEVQQFVKDTSPDVIEAFWGIILHGYETLPARRQNSSSNSLDRPLVIAVGCAHGIHRSRAVKNILFERLLDTPQFLGHQVSKE